MLRSLALSLALLLPSAELGAQGTPVGQLGGPTPNGAGLPAPWQARLRGGPNFVVNLANGNVHFSFQVGHFGGTGLAPLPWLVLHHDSIAVPKTGVDGGFGLGPGWTTSVSGGLAFPTAGQAVWTGLDGTEVGFAQDTNGTWVPTAGYFLELTDDAGIWTVRTDTQWLFRYAGATGELIDIESPTGNVFTVQSTAGQVTRTIDPTGREMTFGFDAAGELDSITSVGYQSKFVDVNANGWLEKIAFPPHGDLLFSYDVDGRLTGYTTVEGHSWAFAYGTTPGLAEGRIETITDPVGNETRFTYAVGSGGNLKTTVTDPRGHAWLYVHDREASPALVRARNPLGLTRRYTVDANRRLTKFTTPEGHEWESTYDGQGRQLTLEDPLDAVTTFTWDSLGNLTSRSFAGLTTTLEYTSPVAPTLLSKVVYPPAQSGGVSPEITLEYFGPADGDAPGEWTGLLEKIVGPMGGETRYEYDDHGVRVAIEEGPAGATGGLRIETSPVLPPLHVDLGGMTYPTAFPTVPAGPPALQGRLWTTGGVTQNGFGAPAEQDVSVHVPIASPSGWESSHVTVDYVYDHKHRLVSVARTTEEPLFHVTSPPASPAARTATHVYDDDHPDGLRVLTTPDGQVVSTESDSAGRVTSLQTGGGGAGELGATFTYTDDDLLASIVRNDGTSTHLTYRDDGRVETIEHRLGTTLLRGLALVYDARGPVASQTDTTASGTILRTFQHDDLLRLTRETHQNVATGSVEERRYTYDLVGNRTSHELRIDGQLVESATYFHDLDDVAAFASHNNRLTRIERLNGAGQPKSTTWCRYDNPFGSMSRVVTRLAGSSSYAATVFRYTALGQPWLTWDESWTDTGSGPQGVQRSRVLELRQEGPAVTLWRERDATTLAPVSEVWSDGLVGWNSSYEVSASSGSVVPRSLGLPRFGRLESGQRTYSFHDALGGVLFELGASVSTRSYAAFGDVLATAGAQESGFHGAFGARSEALGAELNDLGTVQIGYRMYAPSLGRFVMRDPIGHAGGFHLYAFVDNSPTAWIDPLGLSGQDPFFEPPSNDFVSGYRFGGQEYLTKMEGELVTVPSYGTTIGSRLSINWTPREYPVLPWPGETGPPTPPHLKSPEPAPPSNDPNFVGPPAPTPEDTK